MYVFVCVSVCVCVHRGLLAHISDIEVHGLHIPGDRERAQGGAVVRDDLQCQQRPNSVKRDLTVSKET